MRGAVPCLVYRVRVRVRASVVRKGLLCKQHARVLRHLPRHIRPKAKCRALGVVGHVPLLRPGPVSPSCEVGLVFVVGSSVRARLPTASAAADDCPRAQLDWRSRPRHTKPRLATIQSPPTLLKGLPRPSRYHPLPSRHLRSPSARSRTRPLRVPARAAFGHDMPRATGGHRGPRAAGGGPSDEAAQT